MINGLTSIILPIYNLDYPLAHYTGNCIGSIKYFTNKEKTRYEIIVIDQASTCELGGLKWNEVVDKYKRFDDNKGYTGGMNRGIEIAEGEFICLMSSDVEVYDFWLEDLQDALNSVDMTMATPMYDLPYGRAKEALARRKEWLDKSPDEFLRDFRDFSCVLTKREIFDKIGLFDEAFGSYGEDIDLVFRLEEAGLTVKSTKKCNTHHIGMATGYVQQLRGENIGEQMNRNKEYLKKKWDLDQFGLPRFKRSAKV